ncbi:conserved Plasmodium protein, unknown function [Plasmodium ovale]|uniref:Chromatin target of PRMT1 protein C-terminal domain-containing protein n=2 Tax=Plasmodium ovale TaxID=36330 RepID=A0A1A8VUY0_PLAOA|nr:conserved Plasmodium protein, unknown function [Plasmodium ovale curtisi]SBS92558.1 conserved Plasmodium protein, unknown function [Plasmodium ovale curtisi]SCQ16469.1 conserved Plasmodium protein, unknown function [Plasmodium ovale]
MNRRYYKRGGNTFFFKNKRRLGNKFQDRSFGNMNGHDSFFRKSKGNNFRKGRVNFRNIKRRTMYNKKTEVLHGKIGKLSSKTLDEELDNYMGTSNIKTRLDNDLESYFKNSGILQVDVNKGFNKVAE